MKDIKRILVAVKEPVRRSSPAVARAAQIARACGARLELFHTLTQPVYTDYSAFVGDQNLTDVLDELRRLAIRQLERQAARLRAEGLQVSVAASWDHPAYQGIVRHAQSVKADLVVIEAPAGRRRLASLLRLTDWELVRWSPVPVLIVRRHRPYQRPAVLAAVDPGHAFAKPLALDRTILQTGGWLSDRLGGTLHAVHAYPQLPLADLPPAGRTQDTLKRVERRSRVLAAQRLEEELKDSGIARSRRYLIAGHPVDAIATAARRSRAAIVVMGAVSRSGLKGLFIGNTAERILDRVGCDLLIVKPERFRTHVSRRTKGPQLVTFDAMASW